MILFLRETLIPPVKIILLKKKAFQLSRGRRKESILGERKFGDRYGVVGNKLTRVEFE